ncbi:hypothetical protein [Azospirillum sp. SYSU D00513]|uniref:hypothetical protein n=1 Tax=Azospirillum sp. SYSU D00513 TaxID=2812561 RepID=UPI001A977954|nr:hypothetical protein [Azospirillum sp. SYSU D00513]
MKKALIKDIAARMVTFDYQAIGGPMRAFCAEMTARDWLKAHGFWGGPIEIHEIVEWERSPTDRAADVEFTLFGEKAKFRDLIQANLPVRTGGVAEAGDLMQFMLDGKWAFFDHSCSSWTGFGVTESACDGSRGFTLDPDFAKAWVSRGLARLRLHTQKRAVAAAA